MKLRGPSVWALSILFIWGALLGGAHLSAQAGNGTLTATIVDAQGGALPGATVTVTEQATNATRTITTDPDGVFRIAALPPGRYSIEIAMEGFSPLKVTDISLAPAEVRSLEKIELKIGQLSESVVVAANATTVQTATSSRMGTVTAEQLTNIQMKGRDVWGMLAVIPGVQDTNMNRSFTTWTSMEAITINGSPNTSKVVVIDGVNVVDELGTQAQVNPNMDAVGEVQVISSGYTAENGRSSGGLIIMTTKSGTSQFKGSGWYNARRKEWRANEYFRKKNNQEKSDYKVNIPGYSVGGPLFIPKLLDRGKMFFFVSQEYTDDLRPATFSRTNYPTALERQGDFSQTYSGNSNGPGQGTVQPIINPDTGQQFPGNKIPLSCAGIPGCVNGYLHPLGQRMLNLLPLPNGYFDPANNQYNAYNYGVDTFPYHSRTNNTVRLDVVLNPSVRGSFRFIKDREDNISNNVFAPGIGWSNNAVPGYISTGSLTQVLGPRLVNETTIGFAHNSYAWYAANGDHYEDYTQYYRAAVGLEPPRLEPFGAYRDPQGLGYNQSDEYPYLPAMTYGANGQSRANLASYNPGRSAARILPAANRNDRWTFTNDLSWTRGRHNMKFGVLAEWASKTEPLSPDYAGTYAFGHNAENPLSTGNGFANALLGTFTTYTELTNRVDRDRRHWQTEGYLQDSWRAKPGLTIDYGVRLTHTGSYFDTRQSTAGFYEPNWSATQAPRLYKPTCTTGVPGNVACAANSQRAYDPANPGVLLSSAFIGNIVPGSGTQINGMVADGYPGMRPGEYFKFTPLVAAPRVGVAWDINGNGKQALRASGGTFYAIPTRGAWEGFVGTAPAAFNRQVRWATFSDIENFATSGKTFVETPINAQYAGGETRSLEKSYNLNLTYQRDVGFNTTAEVAYVGSWTYGGGRTDDINRPVNNVYLLGTAAGLFNNNQVDINTLRTAYPGMGSIMQWKDVKDGFTVNNNTLRYNAMQVNVQRRLHQGLQMGLAYTLAKGVGWNGYNQDYLDADPTGALNRLRLWGPTANDRTHNLTLNYSYALPKVAEGVPVVNAILRDWMVSGVTKYLSGAATQPACTTNTTGVANQNPTLTPGATAACVYTGEPLFIARNPDLPEEDQLHFNPAAFAMAKPLSATVGNFGDVPLGILRNPGFWNWDLTLQRRFPIKAAGRQIQARLQLQLYNVFNTPQFNQLNTTLTYQDDPNIAGPDSLLFQSTLQGRYTAANPPREFGVTFRVDW